MQQNSIKFGTAFTQPKKNYTSIACTLVCFFHLCLWLSCQKCIRTLLRSAFYNYFRALRASLTFTPSHQTMVETASKLKKGKYTNKTYYPFWFHRNYQIMLCSVAMHFVMHCKVLQRIRLHSGDPERTQQPLGHL